LSPGGFFVMRSVNNPWLHRFAVLTACSTLFLITVGGMVTSHGVGMAVPDWPTSYGYNMFLLPFSYWLRNFGAFWEHSHRLAGASVGLLTTILAVWLALKESRGWLRKLGWLAFALVIFQGLLGGFRVIFDKHGLGFHFGVFHALVAQVFFTLTCLLAIFTSRSWGGLMDGSPAPVSRALRRMCIGAVVLVLGQLLLGASMRHQHAGLAVPDFPLAHGRLWPATDAASLARYEVKRSDLRGYQPLTAGQIHLHMAHRIGALLTVFAAAVLGWRASRELGRNHLLARVAWLWLAMILAQATLGAFTVWTDKAADVATAHVAFGAISLVVAVVMGVVACMFSLNSATRARIMPPCERISPSPHGNALTAV
jgi:cytochrome c oxidase assembly protein subunit 15